MRNLKLILVTLATLVLVAACAKQEAVETTEAPAAPTATQETATPAPEATEAATTEMAEPEAAPAPAVAEAPAAKEPVEAKTNRPAPMLPRRGEVASIQSAAHETSAAETSQRVKIPDAYEILRAGNGVLVDVRSADAFKYEHIPGAISIPLGEVADRANELPQDKWIITYCTCPAEESSGAAAATLSNMGFERVAALLGGMQGWRAANLPIEFGQ